MSLHVLHVNDVSGVASSLVHGLQALGVNAELYQPTIGTYRASRSQILTLPFVRTKEAIQLKRYINNHRFDVVHIHYGRFAYMALLTGTAYYLHIHGGDMYFDMKHPLWRPLTILGMRRAKKVFYSTPDLKKLIQPFRPDAIFLPNPIDLNQFCPKKLDNHKLDSCLLSISKLDRRKGMDFIFQIIELLLQMDKNVKIALFGFGDTQKRLHTFFERHVNDSRLIALSRTPHEKMPDLINSFPVILGQHSFEVGALGVSELEAMACGKPVLCYYAYPEAYPTPPPVIISNSPEVACQHIKVLMDDSESRSCIGKASRSWMEMYHEIVKVSKSLLDCYE